MTMQKRKRRRVMLGLSFISPALVTMMAMADSRLRVFLVTDDTTRDTVREWMSMKLTGTKKEKTFVVAGIKNLQKLGPRPQQAHVIVCDVPQLLGSFPKNIRIGDARPNEDGRWEMVEIDKDDLHKRVRWSEYTTPIHPKKVSEARASFVVPLPNPSKKFDPVEALERLFSSVDESFREDFETGVYEFMAGLIDRRAFATVRRRAFNRVKGRDDKESGQKKVQNFKILFSTVQRWMEAEGEGRAVSDAYQMCAKVKKMKAPIAAGRANANMEVLIRLIRHIPPSRRQEFSGYKFNPRRK